MRLHLATIVGSKQDNEDRFDIRSQGSHGCMGSHGIPLGSTAGDPEIFNLPKNVVVVFGVRAPGVRVSGRQSHPPTRLCIQAVQELSKRDSKKYPCAHCFATFSIISQQ